MTFIDTGAFLARYLQRDQFHDRALKAWQELENAVSEDCFTSNFVLDETFTLLGRHAHYRFAADRARHILASQTLRILRPDSDDEFLAIELFEKYADQRVSFTDCVSFVLINRYRLDRVFSFDRHFERAGFRIWPTEG